MAVFRSPAKQAASVMRELQGSHLNSVGTVRNYEQCLTRVTEWTQTHKLSDGLRGLTVEQSRPDLATPIRTVASPIRLSKTPVRYDAPPPKLGQDTETVLATLNRTD